MVAGYLSSAAAGMLLCIGDGRAAACCPEPGDSRFHSTRLEVPEAPQLGWADCDCCIAVDGTHPAAAVASHKVSLHLAAGPVHLGNVFLPASTPFVYATSTVAGGSVLFALRTVVLLI